jgi:hypothetical protein
MPAAVDLYFNPSLTYSQQSLQPVASPPVLAYADPAPAAAPAPAASQPGYQLASATAAPAKRVEPQRAVAKLNNVFNDTQIASIKGRLKLTPSQERMWPEVEVALRALIYKKPVPGEKQTASTRTLDPASPEVSRLKSVAVPLVLSFDSEQRRELRTLAHLVGLDNLAMQF